MEEDDATIEDMKREPRACQPRPSLSHVRGARVIAVSSLRPPPLPELKAGYGKHDLKL